MNLLIINGPNLNMLGRREKGVYGSLTLDEIKDYTKKKVQQLNLKIDWFQSNSESQIIDKIQGLANGGYYQGLIINPGGLSHTSVVLYDALKMLEVPIIEVHLSQVYSRESFRHHLITAKAATMVMTGVGKDCYHVAVYALANRLE